MSPLLKINHDSAVVAAVVVVFHPDLDHLLRLLRALRDQVSSILLVNNGAALKWPEEQPLNAAVTVMQLETNLGVAAALNAGFCWAEKAGFDFVVSFDQDSEPLPDMVSRLLTAFTRLQADGYKVAAVGAQAVDRRTGRLAPYIAPIAWHRLAFLPSEGARVSVDHLITSGCLTPVSSWKSVGPYWEPLFIDFVDIEWCLRARGQGMQVFGVEGARFLHALGDHVVPCMGKQLPWHTPLRHYYLFRNAVLVLRLKAIPVAWKFSEAWHFFKRALLFSLIARPGRGHRRAILRGLRDGLKPPGTHPSDKS